MTIAREHEDPTSAHAKRERSPEATAQAREWDPAALRDPHSQADKAARVQGMFDAIAPTYERVNTVASFGRDAAWRRRAVTAAEVRAGDVVLDVACGTGDMLRLFAAVRPPPHLIIGVDFAANMLALAARSEPEAPARGRSEPRPSGSGEAGARPAATPVALLRADALRLPLADASVDIISCTFGVRNFQDLDRGLREMRRVLRPGGRVVILEFALPPNPLLRAVYRLYCERILPRLGALLSGDRRGAYRYLPQSVATFAPRAVLAERLHAAGFGAVTLASLNLGGVVLYRAVRP
jgi:demethylmenaquinone methyltransferase / 2-methoxy-6-polyprenyl-1,4-benzoquinol methylase